MTADRAVASWIVEPALERALAEQARRAAPREACGLLVGRVREGCAEVLAAPGARNVEPRPSRFRIHPVDQLAAERAAQRAGLELLGAWHAHPCGGALPSRADLAGSAYPLLAVLALGGAGGPARLAAWWVADGAPELALGPPRRGFATPR